MGGIIGRVLVVVVLGEGADCWPTLLLSELLLVGGCINE